MLDVIPDINVYVFIYLDQETARPQLYVLTGAICQEINMAKLPTNYI